MPPIHFLFITTILSQFNPKNGYRLLLPGKKNTQLILLRIEKKLRLLPIDRLPEFPTAISVVKLENCPDTDKYDLNFCKAYLTSSKSPDLRFADERSESTKFVIEGVGKDLFRIKANDLCLAHSKKKTKSGDGYTVKMKECGGTYKDEWTIEDTGERIEATCPELKEEEKKDEEGAGAGEEGAGTGAVGETGAGAGEAGGEGAMGAEGGAMGAEGGAMGAEGGAQQGGYGAKGSGAAGATGQGADAGLAQGKDMYGQGQKEAGTYTGGISTDMGVPVYGGKRYIRSSYRTNKSQRTNYGTRVTSTNENVPLATSIIGKEAGEGGAHQPGRSVVLAESAPKQADFKVDDKVFGAIPKGKSLSGEKIDTNKERLNGEPNGDTSGDVPNFAKPEEGAAANENEGAEDKPIIVNGEPSDKLDLNSGINRDEGHKNPFKQNLKHTGDDI